MALHNRIMLFRAERGISRRELAEAVGVNNQTIGYLERGDYKPSLELAMKIAQHFGVSVEMLFSFQRFEPIAMTLKRAGEVERARNVKRRCSGWMLLSGGPTPADANERRHRSMRWLPLLPMTFGAGLIAFATAFPIPPWHMASPVR